MARQKKRAVILDDHPPIRRFVASVLCDIPEIAAEYHDDAVSALMSLRKPGALLVLADAGLDSGAEVCLAASSDDRQLVTVLIQRGAAKAPEGARYELRPPYSKAALARIVRRAL